MGESESPVTALSRKYAQQPFIWHQQPGSSLELHRHWYSAFLRRIKMLESDVSGGWQQLHQMHSLRKRKAYLFLRSFSSWDTHGKVLPTLSVCYLFSVNTLKISQTHPWMCLLVIPNTVKLIININSHYVIPKYKHEFCTLFIHSTTLAGSL